MSAEFTYNRTTSDRDAEVASDHIAVEGKWVDFMQESTHVIPSGIVTIVSEAKESITERREDDRHILSTKLYNGGVPFGLIDGIVDDTYPIHESA